MDVRIGFGLKSKEDREEGEAALGNDLEGARSRSEENKAGRHWDGPGYETRGKRASPLYRILFAENLTSDFASATASPRRTPGVPYELIIGCGPPFDET
ncbi:unnamed protein product [Calicophoron daubneyi]|uniref:Uncharacterized protein n=1 Tax=Calicophoron daubneyi TaxID=300641 RepID=A0AAV2TT93_CALDB